MRARQWRLERGYSAAYCCKLEVGVRTMPLLPLLEAAVCFDVGACCYCYWCGTCCRGLQ